MRLTWLSSKTNLFKKTVGMVIAVSLTLTLFTGCSGGTAVESGAETTAASQERVSGTESVETEGVTAESVLAGMSTEQKLAQMITLSMREYGENEDSIAATTELNAVQEELLGKYNFGGFILFAENFTGSEQTVRLTEQIRTADAGENAVGHITPFISVDQEGGFIVRVIYGTNTPGNMLLGATGDAKYAVEAGNIIGSELRALGIDVDFAPVCDVNNNPGNPIIGVRSFGDNAEDVARMVKGLEDGLHDAGAITALKHFPGHGNTDTDSHTGLPLIESTYEELKSNELIPFQAGIDAGTEMIMTAHIQYPNIESETYTSISDGENICLPATLSRTILTDILRDDMGYDGIVITDAMDMQAVDTHFGKLDAAKLAINAGVDVLLMPVIINTPDDIEAMEQYMTDLTALADAGEIDGKRIDESVLRILKMKEKYGLLAYEKPDDEELAQKIRAAKEIVGGEKNRNAEWEIASKGITLVKNEGDLLPLSLKEGEKALILYSNRKVRHDYAMDVSLDRLKEENLITENTIIDCKAYDEEPEEEVLKLAEEYDYVIILTELRSVSELNPDAEEDVGFQSRMVQALSDRVHGKKHKLITVSIHLPYDIAEYAEYSDAVLCAYSAKGRNSAMTPAEGESVGYGVNVPVAICGIFGEYTFEGTLPVNVMCLDENYQYTDEILYPAHETGIK